MKSLLLVLSIVVLVPQISMAQEWAGVLGMSQTTYDPDSGSSESSVGVHGGLQYYYLIGDQLFLRTGALLTQRKGAVDVDNIEFSLLYLDVPVTIEYRLDDTFGFYFGVQLAFLVNDSCEITNAIDCQLNNPNSTAFGIPLGLNLIFDDRFGMEHESENLWSNFGLWPGQPVEFHRPSFPVENYFDQVVFKPV